MITFQIRYPESGDTITPWQWLVDNIGDRSPTVLSRTDCPGSEVEYIKLDTWDWYIEKKKDGKRCHMWFNDKFKQEAMLFKMRFS